MPWEFDNNKPIYIQLVEKMKFKVICGEIPVGGKLASVREMAEEAGVNPNTMQRALAELERQEIVYANRTSGRFVTENQEHIKNLRNEYAINKMKDVTSALMKLGYSKEELLEFINSSL